MTDKEIIKALELKKYGGHSCVKCKYGSTKGEDRCGIKGCNITRNALDLINRQQAEIDNYSHNIKQLTEENMHLHATIKGLQMLLYSFLDTRNGNVVRITDTKLEIIKKPIQAEAIKEFAERLKKEVFRKEFHTAYGNIEMIGAGAIDNLVKEMVGEDK